MGDSVKLEQSLISVESDKASMEIPSSAAGVIKDPVSYTHLTLPTSDLG